MRAVKRAGEDGNTRRLDLLADKLVAAGLAGDVSALREIGDRLDGKAAQPISGRVEHDHTLRTEPLSATDRWLAELVGGGAESKVPKPLLN